MSEPELFWLAAQRDMLAKARSQQRLPHALLIRDAPGAGGAQLALWAAQLALCRSNTPPCLTCTVCRQVTQRQHPDLWLVGLEEEAQQIKVDQIRALAAGLALSGYASGTSVAIIEPAEALNANAANALLKTLEEPRAGVLIILVAGSVARLPATVISRCLQLRIQLPERAACLAWLRAARGAGDWEAVLDVLGVAPLSAVAMDPAELVRVRAETNRALDAARAGRLDMAQTADRWVRDALALRLRCAENWVTAHILGGLGCAGAVTEVHTGAHLPGVDSSMNIRALFRVADALRELSYLVTTPVNKSLALEQVLWQLPGAAQRNGIGP